MNCNSKNATIKINNLEVVILLTVAYNIDAGRDTLYTHDIELTLKRYVISSIVRPPIRWLFYFIEMRALYEYLCLFR